MLHHPPPPPPPPPSRKGAKGIASRAGQMGVLCDGASVAMMTRCEDAALELRLRP